MNPCEEVSLITTPQRTERCRLRSFWPEEPLTAFICAEQRGQCPAGPRPGGAAASALQPLVPPRTGGLGPGTPPPHAAQRASVHDSLLGISYLAGVFLFFFPPWLGFFPHFPSITLARGALFQAAPRARGAQRRVRRPEVAVAVPGKGARARPWPSPAPSIARPLLLLPRSVPAEAQAELRAVVAVPQHYLNVCQ